jgi:FkbM family methyltransferase
MRTVFDIGMYDGVDTAYYLESGYRVVAVEANPELTEAASRKFAPQVRSEQLVCINAAISQDGEPVELALSATDLGSSTLFSDKIKDKLPAGHITVSGVKLTDLFAEYGVPFYLKVDIEGADRFCILSLTPELCPPYLSFEAGDDVDELVSHIANLGYAKFKVIDQSTFREFSNVECLSDRAARKLMSHLGYADPHLIRRAGRYFVAAHSSGPVPWKSDGRWRSLESLRSILTRANFPGWYDIHATLQ